MRNFLISILMAAGLLGAGSAALADQSSAFIDAQAVFQSGLAGSEGDNERASKAFAALMQGDPGNPLYEAYYGSTLTLKARDAWAPWKKVSLGEEGLSVIDKALRHVKPEHDRVLNRGAPVSLEVKLVAISTFLQVPDVVFHRRDQGRNLLAATLTQPLFAQAAPGIRARFHYQAALVARDTGNRAEEKEMLEKSLALDAHAPDAGAAAARLKELGGS